MGMEPATELFLLTLLFFVIAAIALHGRKKGPPRVVTIGDPGHRQVFFWGAQVGSR